MKRICLGTMITLIYQSRIRRSDTYKSVCGGIFAAYGLKIDNYNKELPGHLRSGHDPAPKELVSAARTMSMDDIDKGVEDYVLPLINHEKKVAFFRAIKAVLREDSFTDGALIGRIKGYEKVNILNCNSYYESMLLANVLTYAIASIDNDVCASNIAEIGKEFVDSFLTSGEEIHFISKLINQDEVCPLKRTLKSPAFDRLFLKATDVTITGMTNPARACVYYLDPMNCQFRFRDLKSFISSNIGSYVFSRADKNRIVEFQGTEQAVGSQAIIKFMQRYGSDAETVLGEILLYIFLEQELDAPKIMTKIELEETRGVVSKSDGVHLLSLNLSGQPIHQLVFGASDIVGDLSAAIDRAFNKIVKIEANADEELRMVENTAQWTIYDPETTKYMVELMRPHKGGKSTPEMAFGAFLGYTIKIDPPETDARGELGVRVQASGTSDPTFNEAATNIMIEDAFKTGKVDKGLLKGIKDASLYEEEIQLVSLMRMDFELLEEIIEDLDESDSKIMKQYLLEGRLFKEIADDEGRTYEAIKKRMERIRAEIREEILECLEMNCKGGE